MQKKYLMTPGPTPVPAEVLLAQARPMIHHRTPDFSATLMEAVEGLKYVFQTSNDVLLLACSGTGAMESAFANCFCAGDTVIVARNGKFGDRMAKIAKTYGLQVIDLAYEWTETVKVADVEKALADNPGVRGVVVVQSETSSGVLNDVEAIGNVVARYDDCVFIVDSITGIGAVPCMTDAWGLDVVMTGSQKGLMLPPADELLIERAVLRRTDKRTGQIYHLKYNPPPPDAVLEHRADDQEVLEEDVARRSRPARRTTATLPNVPRSDWGRMTSETRLSRK